MSWLPEEVPGVILRTNDHQDECKCVECYCKPHAFSLRRPTTPPHTWRYPTCPFCKRPAIADVAVPC